MELPGEQDKCWEYKEALGPYLYGELPEDEREAIETHLRMCPSCQQEAQDFRRVLDLLDDEARLESATLPDGFLSARLRKSQAPASVVLKKRQRRRFLYVASMAASFALGIVTASFWVRPMTHFSTGSMSTLFGREARASDMDFADRLWSAYLARTPESEKVSTLIELLERNNIPVDDMRTLLLPYLIQPVGAKQEANGSVESSEKSLPYHEGKVKATNPRKSRLT